MACALAIGVGAGCGSDSEGPAADTADIEGTASTSEETGAMSSSTSSETDAVTESASSTSATSGLTTPAEASSESGATGGIDLYDCSGELLVVAPLAGPGYQPDVGLIDPQDDYVIHTTQLVMSPDDSAQSEFFELSDAVTAQLMETQGLVAVSVALEPECGFARTVGVWRSMESMYAFVGTGAHVTAMQQAPAISLSGRVTHWDATADDVLALDWDVAVEAIGEIDPSPVYD